MKISSKIHTFINERGNKISVSVAPETLDDEITIRLIGPDSESENIITIMEAKAIYDALAKIFD